MRTGLSRSSAPNPSTSAHAHVPSARRSNSLRAEGHSTSPSRTGSVSSAADAYHSGKHGLQTALEYFFELATLFYVHCNDVECVNHSGTIAPLIASTEHNALQPSTGNVTKGYTQTGVLGTSALMTFCEFAGAQVRPMAETTAKELLRPAQNGLKPHHRTGSLRPATRTAVKALPLGLQRNPRRPSSQDTARVQAVARNAAAQSVPPGVVDLIAAAQREINAASASAEQLIRENDFAEDGLDLDFDAFLESDGIAELVAQAQASAGPLPHVQNTPTGPNAHARRAHSPALSQASPAATPPRSHRSVDATSAPNTPISPAQHGTPSKATDSDVLAAAAAKPPTAAATQVTATREAESIAQTLPAATTAASGTPAPTTASTTGGAKELPKGNAKQKRAHKNADAIRCATSSALGVLPQRVVFSQRGCLCVHDLCHFHKL